MPRASISDRIRWDNVAKLGAVLAVVAVVALWPRLQDEPVAVPEGGARPVVAAPRVPAPAVATSRAPRKSSRAAPGTRVPAWVGRLRSKRRAPAVRPAPAKRPARAKQPARETPARTVSPPPAATPAPPPPSAVTAAEFGLR